MKIIKILSIITVLGVLFYGCEKLEAPYKLTVEESERGSSGDTVKNVLIEDYTGHGCPNCPSAAETAQDLKNVYGERVVVLAIHAGYFATPDIFGPDFTTDFRCSAGNTWDEFFGISMAGNPNGLVDRVESSGDYIVAPDNWGTKASERLSEEFLAKITIANNYNAGTNTLNTTINTEFQKNLTGNYSIIAVVTQDSIIAAQKDKRVEGGEVEHYHHEHVVRGSMNGDWGENATGGENPVTGKTYTKNYSITFKDEWVPENCYVAAFVYNESNKTVIQVDEEKVIE